MKTKTYSSLFFAAALVTHGLVSTPVSHGAQPAADVIYSGGDIVTVNELQAEAEAVAVKDGKIVAVGYRDEVMKLKGEKTKLIDLAGQTMIPVLLIRTVMCSTPAFRPCHPIFCHARTAW